MKPFRLTALLRLREQREAALQQRLADLRRQCEDVATAREAVAAARARQGEHLAALHRAARLDVAAADQTWRYVTLLETHIRGLSEELAGLEQQAETVRQELVAASQDRRMLERLRQRQQAAERLERQRQETRASESLVAARVVWLRQAAEAGTEV